MHHRKESDTTAAVMNNTAMKSSLFRPPSASVGAGGADVVHRNHAAAPSGGGGAAVNMDNAEDVNEVLRENDLALARMAGLTGQMTTEAKRLRDDVKEHNSFVDKLLHNVGNASTLVRGTTSRVDSVLGKNGCSATFILAMIVFFVLVGLYYLTKWAWHARSAASAMPPIAIVPSTTTVLPKF